MHPAHAHSAGTTNQPGRHLHNFSAAFSHARKGGAVMAFFLLLLLVLSEIQDTRSRCPKKQTGRRKMRLLPGIECCRPTSRICTRWEPSALGSCSSTTIPSAQWPQPPSRPAPIRTRLGEREHSRNGRLHGGPAQLPQLRMLCTAKLAVHDCSSPPPAAAATSLAASCCLRLLRL